MPSPTQPVTLSASQIAELNQKLSTMRHDINNHLSLIMAALELIRRKPDAIERMSGTLSDQPARISEAMVKYSLTFEQAFGITRG
jgi:hypothetical protein